MAGCQYDRWTGPEVIHDSAEVDWFSRLVLLHLFLLSVFILFIQLLC